MNVRTQNTGNEQTLMTLQSQINGYREAKALNARITDTVKSLTMKADSE